jgi:tRNA nucleotidyltransferase (CCA-adding enzyme)
MAADVDEAASPVGPVAATPTARTADRPITSPDAIAGAIPPAVHALLASLWAAGHGAYVVGGSLRDVVLGRLPADWDLASDARPDRLVDLFPGAVYENRFGTVAVRREGEVFEITTFRTDHDYADFRRPHRVEFGDTIDLDLARRDFTVNAMAWGARPDEAPSFIDPFGGLADARAGTLRAVGDPRARFEEDALRMIRAVRLAATLGFGVEPGTLAGIQARAELVGHLSGERIAAELDKLLGAAVPSVGLRLMSDTDLLAPISADLAAQRGIPQNKAPGEDLWDHTLRTVDAVPVSRPVVRLAALLHDIGKPATFAEGHFIGHDAVGARLADAFLERLRSPRAVRERVVELVRLHMFSYESSWSDAAVRRFIGRLAKTGEGALDELLALREADNIGSGAPADTGLVELRTRIERELAAELVLDRAGLAIDGDDLIRELGLAEGPLLGRILEELLEQVISDPARNERPTLLLLAQAMLTEDR